MIIPAALFLTAQQTTPLPLLSPEVTVRAEVTDDDEVIQSRRLTRAEFPLDTLGKRYRVQIEQAGIHRIEMHSYFFDSYLVLLDAEERQLAEDDDGLIAFNSLIVADLEPGTYFVLAGALHGQRGPFELTLRKGAPKVLSDAELQAAALEDLERGLATVKDVLGPESPAAAARMADLAALLKDQADPQSGRLLLEKSLAIQERVLGKEHPNTIWTMRELGMCLRGLGEFKLARPLLESSVALSERVLGADHDYTVSAVEQLGILCFDVGEYATARLLYERALESRERAFGPDHRLTAKVLNDLAVLFWTQGDDASARRLYERALAIRIRELGPRHERTAFTMRCLAVLLWSQGELAAAQELFEKALAIQRTRLGARHPELLTTQYNLGYVLRSKGEPEAARPLFEIAAEELVLIFGPDHVKTTEALYGLGRVLCDLGERSEGLWILQQALEGRVKGLGPEHIRTVEVLNDVALLLAETGELRTAWNLIRRDHDLRWSRRARHLGGLSESERYRYLARTMRELEVELSLTTLLDDAASRRIAYGDVLAWKGQVSRALTAHRKELAGEMTAAQLRIREKLWNTQAQLSSLVLRGSEARDDGLEDRIELLREERNKLELELERSQAAAKPDVARPGFTELSAALPARSASLDFFVHRRFGPATQGGTERWSWSPARVSVWIVRAGAAEPLYLDLGLETELQQTVRSFLEDLVTRRGVAVESSAEGRAAIAERLWRPIAAHLEEVDTLFVSPDGLLATLPFEVLPIADDGFAIERYSFVYTQDLTTLVEPRPFTPGSASTLLSVGGLDFRARAPKTDASSPPPLVVDAEIAAVRGRISDYWPSLPATRGESQLVLELHEAAFGAEVQRLLLQGGLATEERLKQELPRHALVHLATHGFFQPEGSVSLLDTAKAEIDQERPRLAEVTRHLLGTHPGLLSGLVCAGANRPEEAREDGYLTAEEVGWLDLSGTDIVVLSACETGLGRTQSGEGLIGLRRSFHLAGVRTVISSSWSVRDESTAELMTAFYVNLLRRGQRRVDALRNAQLELLRRNRAEGSPRPSSWGAFVLSGEWR